MSGTESKETSQTTLQAKNSQDNIQTEDFQGIKKFSLHCTIAEWLVINNQLFEVITEEGNIKDEEGNKTIADDEITINNFDLHCELLKIYLPVGISNFDYKEDSNEYDYNIAEDIKVNISKKCYKIEINISNSRLQLYQLINMQLPISNEHVTLLSTKILSSNHMFKELIFDSTQKSQEFMDEWDFYLDLRWIL
ncbi:31228_t:CDS:2, partial [Gigaspora margarita]